MNHAVKTKRSYFLILFGLIFFLVGIGFLFWSVIPTLHDGWRMQSWPAVSGRLTHAALVINEASDQDDSETYRADARYTYHVLGRQFRHDRVAINSGSDNIGNFQKNMGGWLKQRYQQNQPVTVFYDPANPADAVLNRELRWGLIAFKSIFVLLFGGVGAGIIYWGFRGKKVIDTPEAKDKPWLRRGEWQGGVIRSSAKGGMIGIWAFAIIWNLISAPAAFIGIPQVWDEKGAIALVILLFPLVGLGLLYWAIKLTMEWKRFGVTPLTMDPFPGSIGGDVGGEIQINVPYDSAAVFKVTLTCINSYVSGSGKNRSTHERAKWQDEGYARCQPSAGGIKLQFRFQVPAGLKETEEASDNYHFWRLTIEADLEGIDLNRSFNIPVYMTSETSKHLRIDSPKERPRGVAAVSAESLLPLTRNGNITEIVYPMFRKPGRTIGILLFGSIFFGVGLFLSGKAAVEGFMLYFMSSVFSFIGGAILVWGLYSFLNALRVRYDGQTLHVTRSILGFKVRDNEVAYFEISSIKGNEGMKSSAGGKHTIEYNVSAKTSSKKLVLAEALSSASQKNLVIEYFEKEFLNKDSAFEL